MNSRRIHDRTSFFKYVSISTAHKIIRNKSLRWSSPIHFDDLFDVPFYLASDVEPSNLAKYIAEHLISLVKNEVSPHQDQLNEQASFILNLVKSVDEASKEQIIEVLRQPFEAPTNTAALEELREMWKSQYEKIRILCLSATPSSAAMWSSYAENHTGVVIELACSDELDSPWLLAKKINYSDEPLFYQSTKGWAEALLYNPLFSLTRIFEEYSFTKTSDWRGQEEWRVATYAADVDEGTFNDYKLNPDHFLRFYLGAKMGDDRDNIINEISLNFPKADIFQAKLNQGRKIEFHHIS